MDVKLSETSTLAFHQNKKFSVDGMWELPPSPSKYKK